MPAGFGPRPCKTDAEKLSNAALRIAPELCNWNQTCSSDRWHGCLMPKPLNRQRRSTWPWRSACETPEQQQDSGPGHAKRTPKNFLTSPLESIEKNIAPELCSWNQTCSSDRWHGCLMPKPLNRQHRSKWPWRSACETPEQQQDSGPAGHAKRTPKNPLTSPLQSIEKNSSKLCTWNQKCRWNRWRGCLMPEPLNRQCLNKWPWRSACRTNAGLVAIAGSF